MKYYFITYAFQTRNNQDWDYADDVTDQHPVLWLLECKEQYSSEGDDYKLIFWSEIPKAVYDAADGIVG